MYGVKIMANTPLQDRKAPRELHVRILGRAWKIVIIVILSLAALIYFSISAGLLWFIFLTFLLYGWDTTLLGSAAIFCLTVCAIILGINGVNANIWAEQMAVYGWYFIVMVVVLQMIEYKRHPVQDREEEKQGTRKTGSVIDLRPQHKKVP
jgi:predicted membrane protein